MRVYDGPALLALLLAACAATGCSCEPEGAAADAASADVKPACVWGKPETCRVAAAVKIKWQLYIPCNCVPGGPSVAKDGTIYLAVGGKFTLGSILYAVDPGGKLKWTATLKGLEENDNSYTPVVGPDGAVHVTSDDGYLHRFGPDGKLQWKLRFDGPLEPWDTEGRVATRPVVSSAGVIYLAAADRQVYAIDPGGKLLWRHKTQHQATYSGVHPVLADGRLFVPVRSPAQIIALDAATGKEKWKQDLDAVAGIPGRINTPSAASGRVLVTWYRDRSVNFALSQQDGKEVWHHDFPSTPIGIGPLADLLVGHDGDITAFVISTAQGTFKQTFTYVQGWDPGGKLLYSSHMSKVEAYRAITIGPLAADGELYSIAMGETVLKDGKFFTPFKLMAFSVHQRRFRTLLDLSSYDGLWPSAPALLADGTLLLTIKGDGKGATNTHLLAIQTQSAGLPSTGWPRAGHDNRSSGDWSTSLP